MFAVTGLFCRSGRRGRWQRWHRHTHAQAHARTDLSSLPSLCDAEVPAITIVPTQRIPSRVMEVASAWRSYGVKEPNPDVGPIRISHRPNPVGQ